MKVDEISMSLELKSNLDTLLMERGWNQKMLVEATGLNPRTISELINNKTIRFNKHALEKIAEALGIDDVSKIIQFERNYGDQDE